MFDSSTDVTTDSIIDAFDSYLNDNISLEDSSKRTTQIKSILKRLAFFDKSDKIWILRD